MTAEIWDIVIVGAGLSGLSAAHLLRKRDAKLRVLILEGKERVGGRTVTCEIPAANGSDCWDFGGQWVGSTQTHIMELIKELGLETYPQFTSGKTVHHMGGPDDKIRTCQTTIPTESPVVLMDVTQLLWKIDKLSSTVCLQDPSRTLHAAELDSITLHTFIEKHTWTKEAKGDVGVLSRTLFGMEPSQMSLLFFLWYAAAAGGVMPLMATNTGSAQEFKIKGGTQQLSELLAEHIGWENVRLGSAVTAIWQDGEWAKVKTATNTFLCKAVIVTCPPHLAAKIQYQPALPHQREFLTQNMPVGHMIKFLITYQTAFWREKGYSGEIAVQPSNDCPFSVTFDATSPNGNAALVGFIAGQQASQWSSKEAAERRNAVLSSLVKYLGSEAASFIHYEEKDWAMENYSGGCPVNVMSPGLLTYYHPSLRKPCGRIHWSGTETATQWCGYMSGAVQAGQRAALEVLAEICPMKLTREDQEEIQHYKTVDVPAQKTPSLSIPLSLCRNKAVVIAILTISAAVLLIRHQNTIHKIKICFTSVPSTAMHYMFKV
ncbi:probable flavin-containing monoamine oxidase A [Thalassophryne amazonica]|uniref:probable flavin-containing monoamine oxidase A n=1 Tax=Thalassophryne amazonica TaxID=390379 RepID=UPI001471A15D|nr:probable flavin-containing monoamine oxidase A [Thalassophryne amazonica]